MFADYTELTFCPLTMRVRIYVIVAFQYEFNNFFEIFFNRRKKDFIKIFVVNLCKRIKTHNQKEKLYQVKLKFVIIYKLTCNKFVEC